MLAIWSQQPLLFFFRFLYQLSVHLLRSPSLAPSHPSRVLIKPKVPPVNNHYFYWALPTVLCMCLCVPLIAIIEAYCNDVVCFSHTKKKMRVQLWTVEFNIVLLLYTYLHEWDVPRNWLFYEYLIRTTNTYQFHLLCGIMEPQLWISTLWSCVWPYPKRFHHIQLTHFLEKGWSSALFD